MKAVVLAFIAIVLGPGSKAAADEMQLLTPEEMVSVFQTAMLSGPDANNVESTVSPTGFETVDLENADGQVRYVEMLHENGLLYVVAHGNRRDFGGAFESIFGKLLVTQYRTDSEFYGDLKRVARDRLPPGPDHRVDLTGGFSDGIAWGAAYPGVISLQIKFHEDERASMIEASWLYTK